MCVMIQLRDEKTNENNFETNMVISKRVASVTKTLGISFSRYAFWRVCLILSFYLTNPQFVDISHFTVW